MRQDDNFPSHPGRPFSWTPGRIAESAVTDEGVTQHENETRRFVSGSFVDTSRRPFAIYRGGGVEPAGNLFKRGVDSLDDVQDSSLWGRISAGYRNGSGAVLGVYARSTQLLGDNVFQRGYHTLDDVQDSSIWGRINVGYRNTGGAVTAVLQSGVALPGDNVFKRGFHTLADVLDGGGYGRVNLSGGVYSVPASEFRVGMSGIGNGGHIVSVDDGGGVRWAAGVLGYASARKWELYDNIRGVIVMSVSETDGSVSVPTLAADSVTISQASGTQTALRFGGTSVGDIQMSGGGSFRIINSAYTFSNFSVDQGGNVAARASFNAPNFIAAGASGQYTLYDRTYGSGKTHVLYADGGTGRWWVGSVGDVLQVDYASGNMSAVHRFFAAGGVDVSGGSVALNTNRLYLSAYGDANHYIGRDAASERSDWYAYTGVRLYHTQGGYRIADFASTITLDREVRFGSHVGRPGATALGFYCDDVATAFTSAAVQIREAQAQGNAANTGSGYAPRIAFHWGGLIASQIAMELDGTLAIRNNPGTGYEKFKALSIRAYDDLSADGNIILNTAGKNFLNHLGHKMCPVIFSTLAPSGSAEDGTLWVQY